MEPANAFLTEEYLRYRQSFDYVYDEKYKTGAEERLLPDEKHRIVIRTFEDDSCSVQEYRVISSLTEVFNQADKKVAEVKCIGADANFFTLVRHSNGTDYLITREDLYGYTVLDLTSYSKYSYMPIESFYRKGKEFEETFIWTETLYNKDYDVLAAYGCYWGGPYCTEFYDFAHPESQPYERIFTSEDFEDAVLCDGEPMRWDEYGKLEMEYTEGYGAFTRIVDMGGILSGYRKHRQKNPPSQKREGGTGNGGR